MDNTNAIFENDVEMYISEYMEKYNIQDMYTENQNRWNGCLAYVGKHLFRGTRLLKDTRSQYNEYDIFKICDMLDIYIALCDDYGKEISIAGFSRLIDISQDTIDTWKEDTNDVYRDIDDNYICKSNIYNICVIDGVRKLTCKRSYIHKILIKENERSNSDLLSSSPRTIGIVARLNHVHGWNMPGVRESSASKALTARESVVQLDGTNSALLPDLSNNDNK